MTDPHHHELLPFQLKFVFIKCLCDEYLFRYLSWKSFIRKLCSLSGEISFFIPAGTVQFTPGRLLKKTLYGRLMAVFSRTTSSF